MYLAIWTGLSVGTIAMVRYYPWIYKQALSSVNYVMDRYLDYKYQDFICPLTPIKNYEIIHLSTCAQYPHVVYIHYRYGDETYVLPWKSDKNPDLSIPIYDMNDVETCIKIDYEGGTLGGAEPPHDPLIPCSQVVSLDLLRQYAGPKGNFYCDTPHRFEPSLIIDDKGSPLLSENDVTLTLVTIVGSQYIFNRDQAIVVNGLFCL